jgi:hypothetical protein
LLVSTIIAGEATAVATRKERRSSGKRLSTKTSRSVGESRVVATSGFVQLKVRPLGMLGRQVPCASMSAADDLVQQTGLEALKMHIDDEFGGESRVDKNRMRKLCRRGGNGLWKLP